jgi:hypothetical protein
METIQRRSQRRVLKISQNFLWLYTRGRRRPRRGCSRFRTAPSVMTTIDPMALPANLLRLAGETWGGVTRRCSGNKVGVKRHPQRQIIRACLTRDPEAAAVVLEHHFTKAMQRALGLYAVAPARVGRPRQGSSSTPGALARQRPNQGFESPSLRQSALWGHSFPAPDHRSESRSIGAFPPICPNHRRLPIGLFWAFSPLCWATFSDATEPRPFWYGCWKLSNSMG